MKWFSVILLLSQVVWGQSKFLNDFDPEKDLISEEYTAGAFLIYDCKERHWVCVMASDFEACQKGWSQENKEFSDRNKCFPVKEFPNKKSCFQEQLFLVSQNHSAQYCEKLPWRQKAIGL